MNQENKFQPEFEEINLMDYVKVLLKRKWLILVVFLGAAIAAGVFSYLMPKIYKIDTFLEIGTTEVPIQVVEKVKSDAYGVLIREKLGIPEEKYPRIEAENPEDTNLITIKIESGEPQQAKTVLEGINDLIIIDHQERVKTNKELIEHNIKTIEAKIHLVESDIEKTKNKIKPIEGDIKRVENKIDYTKEEKKSLEAKVEALEKVLIYEQTPGTQFALFDAKEKLAGKKQEIENLFLSINSLKRDKEDLDIQINSLEGKIEDLRAQINSLKASLDNIKITRIVKSPTISKYPIKPRPLLNIVLAGVLGIFLGTFLAFGKEWWEKNSEKLR